MALQRNPQYLTPAQMEALVASIRREGFVVPVLARPAHGGTYEIISGNHRVMAAQRVGLEWIPAIVKRMTDADRDRLSINLNTIHGDPSAIALAPLLSGFDDATLAGLFLEPDLRDELLEFDRELQQTLAKLDVPEAVNQDSPLGELGVCVCPRCHKRHRRADARIASAPRSSPRR